MSPTRVAAILLIVVAYALGGFLTSARADTRYYYDYQNRLAEIDFDDHTWIVYSYDTNGNQTAKTYHNTDFFPITVTSGAGGTISPSSANVWSWSGVWSGVGPNAAAQAQR